MPEDPVPVTASPDEKRQADARRYSALKRRLYFIELALDAALIVILVFTGLSRSLAGLIKLPLVPAAVCYFLLLIAAYALVTAPLSYYSGFVLPRRYGLTRQNFAGWLVDALKGGVLSLFLGAIIVALVYSLMHLSPLWWLWTWVATIVISLVLSILAPVVILPLFFKTRPLPEGELRTSLEELAARAKLEVKGIYTVEFSAKTSTANAALMGIGHTRRILLSDTLTGTYTTDEILTVMGHEMGHQRHGDTLRLFVFQGLILLGTFYLASILLAWGVRSLDYAGITDVAALPLLLMVIGAVGLLTGPVLAGFSRYVESQADLYSLKLTNKPGAFISAMSKLTDQNLSEIQPPRWVEVLMDDHPSYRQRVDMARRYKPS